ncbi:flagellar basal body P-ring formation chaperone FlgA [Colwellia sp. E2M01]|uniref:flagellar basal body P-ring formation chaperone FlgA n=1 Tax=Colwellia sp. E2M01 TaxID=2841561 RepID=UPI001C0A1E00|nr:flagellar basal body P-ring formation chaperone FlgA [Colwellia sp. E2M01]MBU2869993.1 flagellar basal body P-ring formation protein FlgA [Colwellia sp. E2M01]
MRLTTIFSLILFLLLIKHTTTAATELNSDYIEQFATNYLIEQFPSTAEERVLITVAEIDPRITIQACAIPLTAELPDKSSSRNVNVKISCDESTPWKIYLSAKVEITKAFLVAKHTINKGDILDENNVELTYMPINRIRGKKLTDTAEVFGAKAKRRIAKNKLVNKHSICLVCKGDIVTIVAASSSFNIKTQGEALSSANMDEQIRVRNSRSNKVITAHVKGINQVIINL